MDPDTPRTQDFLSLVRGRSFTEVVQLMKNSSSTNKNLAKEEDLDDWNLPLVFKEQAPDCDKNLAKEEDLDDLNLPLRSEEQAPDCHMSPISLPDETEAAEASRATAPVSVSVSSITAETSQETAPKAEDVPNETQAAETSQETAPKAEDVPDETQAAEAAQTTATKAEDVPDETQAAEAAQTTATKAEGVPNKTQAAEAEQATATKAEDVSLSVSASVSVVPIVSVTEKQETAGTKLSESFATSVDSSEDPVKFALAQYRLAEAALRRASSQSHPDGHIEQDLAYKAVETQLAIKHNVPWRDRGPKDSGLQFWRGNQWRDNSQRYANRGGKHREYFKAKYGLRSSRSASSHDQSNQALTASQDNPSASSGSSSRRVFSGFNNSSSAQYNSDSRVDNKRRLVA